MTGPEKEVDTFTECVRNRSLERRKAPITPRLPPGFQLRPSAFHTRNLDMHRQSIASRSQFGQSSAQSATAQALRNKKKEYEAISALEQSCAGLIATLEEMATDLNTTAEATIGRIGSPKVSLDVAERCFVCLVAIGKAMEHWTDMFQILSISRALISYQPSQGYALKEFVYSRGFECARSAIASKPSGPPVARYFAGETGR